MEGRLQAEIARWLRGRGAFVIVTRPAPGTPAGCPDIIFLYEGAWGAIEVKREESAPFRPGQEPTLKRLGDWSPFVWVAYPENWPSIKQQLTELFF